MKLNGLIPLYKNMCKERILSAQFRYSIRDVHFEIFFVIDCEPFELLFGHKGKETFAFAIGFEINPIIDREAYYKLCNTLKSTDTSFSTLKMSTFFSEFNTRIPTVPKKHSPSDKAAYYSDIEEVDKIYFIGWRNNNHQHQSVTIDNLEKTKKLIGYKAFLFCKKHNVSSRWSGNSAEAKEYDHIAFV